MIIQPNEEGWRFSGELQEDQFCFVHKDRTRIFYGKSNISTTDTLFIGTKEECEAEMVRLGIPIVYRVISENSNVIFFGPKIDSDVYEGNEFLGTEEECEAEIVRINTETFDQTKYKLIYDNDYVILYFGTEANAPQINEHEFVGSKEECEVEIIRLNLTYEKHENTQEEVIQGPYRLVYDENNNIVFFGPQTDETPYEGIEFLGTKEECEAEIDRLSAEASNNVPYKLIYDENLGILFFGPESENTEVRGMEFLGSKQECETEITRLDLRYPPLSI